MIESPRIEDPRGAMTATIRQFEESSIREFNQTTSSEAPSRGEASGVAPAGPERRSEMAAQPSDSHVVNRSTRNRDDREEQAK